MSVAIFMNAHDDTELVLDTIESVTAYVTSDMVTVVDGSFWESWGEELELPVHKMCGFRHKSQASPYRNILLGMKTAFELFPFREWYGYIEPDVLFGSSHILKDLQSMQEDVYLVGFDHRSTDAKFEFLDRIVGMSCPGKYVLGCCFFLRREFVRRLIESNFVDRFLEMTNELQAGYFPGYDRSQVYDFAEHLFPSMAAVCHGGIHGISFFDVYANQWVGDDRYLMRWQPAITEQDPYQYATIMHPVKSYDDPIRVHHRRKRRGQ